MGQGKPVFHRHVAQARLLEGPGLSVGCILRGSKRNWVHHDLLPPARDTCPSLRGSPPRWPRGPGGLVLRGLWHGFSVGARSQGRAEAVALPGPWDPFRALARAGSMEQGRGSAGPGGGGREGGCGWGVQGQGQGGARQRLRDTRREMHTDTRGHRGPGADREGLGRRPRTGSPRWGLPRAPTCCVTLGTALVSLGFISSCANSQPWNPSKREESASPGGERLYRVQLGTLRAGGRWVRGPLPPRRPPRPAPTASHRRTR